MRGDDEVIALLNEQLTSELTAINQYFLHSKMQANWGFTKLAEHTRAESIEEMQHAEKITNRILFLEGLPNYQRLFSLRIGQTVREQFNADLAVELEVVERLRPGIAMCREKGDITTANLFEEILHDEEEHIDYLETNLELMEKLGEQQRGNRCSLAEAEGLYLRPYILHGVVYGGHRGERTTWRINVYRNGSVRSI
jgi:bacterioferritin